MPRLVSVFTNAYGPYGVRAAVENVREAGIRHLELALRAHNFGGLVIPESAVVTEAADDATASAFVEMLRAHDVRISGCNVGGGDMRTDEGTALTVRRMRFAARWFTPPVVVSGAGRPENADERAAVVRNLRRIGDVAAELGQIVALETHAGPTQNSDAMLALMNDVDHLNVRLNFDTGNIAYYNAGMDPIDELRRVAPLVVNVHAKDNRGAFEEWYFPALGDGGAVDFVAVRETLDAVGYKGAYTIEIEGIADEPELTLPARQERIRRSVQHLHSCSYFS